MFLVILSAAPAPPAFASSLPSFLANDSPGDAGPLGSSADRAPASDLPAWQSLLILGGPQAGFARVIRADPLLFRPTQDREPSSEEGMGDGVLSPMQSLALNLFSLGIALGIFVLVGLYRRSRGRRKGRRSKARPGQRLRGLRSRGHEGRAERQQARDSAGIAETARSTQLVQRQAEQRDDPTRQMLLQPLSPPDAAGSGRQPSATEVPIAEALVMEDVAAGTDLDGKVGVTLTPLAPGGWVCVDDRLITWVRLPMGGAGHEPVGRGELVRLRRADGQAPAQHMVWQDHPHPG